MKKIQLSLLASLVFKTRQLVRAQLPERSDTSAWLRLEVLAFIDHRADPTMREIAEYLRVRPPSATSLVWRLARAGLVVRKTFSGDRRAVHVSLTAKGRAELGAHRRAAVRALQKMFSKLTEPEISALIEILERLTREGQ